MSYLRRDPEVLAAQRRASKDRREHRARFHPSRLAQARDALASRGERLRMTAVFSIAVIMILASQQLAQAQSGTHFSPFFRFTEQTGEQLFANVCQGCHMGDGRGAEGAGSYPSLAQNANLISGGYPVYVVVRGQRAMPAFGAMMSDDQIAAVVNYVRTHFGNDYTDAVSAHDVKAARP